ncbi:unnamed protein product [Musa acuminata subsp. malaccensis]|nr:PREDICTED: uncharacterized protein LOC103976522 [Musa acuminata subsp. malaccensis]CAG1862804.1 unnamed protein product [Musa acuminata subsp. malaccensis]
MELHPGSAIVIAPANRGPGVRVELVPSSSSEDPPAKSSEELVDACSKKSTREERAACSTEVAMERVGAHAAEESGRERLKRHRMEMAGRVWIPETWGQENRLKDWIDSSVFDRPLVPKGLVSAREALVEACRRTSSRSRQIRNPC